MEYTVTIQRRVWSGSTPKNSEKYGLLHKNITLPFVPFVGLQIWVGVPSDSLASEGQRAIELASVAWSSKENRFYCMDREWFGHELQSYSSEHVDIKDYLEEEVSVFWDKFGLSGS